MSVHSYLSIEYYPPSITLTGILEVLFTTGWCLGKNTMLVPLGKTVGDWTTRSKISKQDLFALVVEKEQLGEHIGVVLTHPDGPGISFLVYEKGSLSFDLGINRKLTEECASITDIDWYIKKLVCPLLATAMTITSLEWREDR